MGVLTMLAVVVSTFVSVSRLNNQAAVARTATVRAEVLLEGVLNQIRTLLARDLDIDQEPFDHPRFDPWLASVMTDNSGFFSPATGEGSVYRYISRLDIADNGWNSGVDAVVNGVVVGPTAGGRNPNLPSGANRLATVVGTARRHLPTFGVFSDPTRAGVPQTAYYVDADGDGKCDALLTAIGNGVAYPDGTCAYMAVRIVDNAHLNANQHSKWPPFYNYTVDTRPNHVWDTTSGLVDWTYLPDSSDPTGTQFIRRPRLPHVSFKNLRNIAMGSFGLLGDSPDPGETGYFSGVTGWSWDEGLDRLTLTDRLYFAYEPGNDFALTTPPWTGMGGTGTPVGGAQPWMNPTNSVADRADCTTNRFTIDDDLALRTWAIDPRLSKYAQVYPSVFGTNNVGSGAMIVNLGGNAATNDPNAQFERNFMRCVSSVTRERTKRWMTAPSGQRVHVTPFDLRKLVGPSDYDGQGAPTGQLLGKLNTLMAWMGHPQFNILGRPGLSATGAFDIPPAERRAQYLANLCEYIKAPPAPGQYTPAAYLLDGMGNRPVYGVCRQPFLSEVLRDAGPGVAVPGAVPPAAQVTLPPGAARNFSSVQVAIELYNPYDTWIDLSRYRLDVRAVGTSAIVSSGAAAEISLAPAQRIAPFGYLVLATDAPGTTVPGTQVARSVARLALSAVETEALRRAGPRLLVQLRCTATNGVPILMDCCDTRPRTGVMPHTAGNTLNAGFQERFGSNTSSPPLNVVHPQGLDFSDWDGFGAPNPAAVVALANAGFVNNSLQPVTYRVTRSSVFRPMTAPWSGSRVFPWGGNANYWYPASAVSTNLWLSTASRPGSLVPTWNAATFFYTMGTQNWHQGDITRASTPCLTQTGNLIFGTRVLLPNRGFDELSGARFFNLGELALVMTVGNGYRPASAGGQTTPEPTDPNAEYCLSQFLAAASEYSRTRPMTANGGVINPVTRTYEQPLLTSPGPNFPGNWASSARNKWHYINFETQVKYNIYEGVSMRGSGLPAADNARLLDLVSLYMGTGGELATATDFQPWGGQLEDTGDDFLPPFRNSRVRAGYREGRININTAPYLVTRCLPYPFEGRSDVLASPPPSGWYSDGATAGLNVYFAESLSGCHGNPTIGSGYVNTIIPGINKDPYFAEISDIYLFAQSANPRVFSNFYRNAGLGWDCLPTTGCGGWVYSLGSPFGFQEGTGVIHPHYKSVPQCYAYMRPDNKRVAYPNGPMDFPETGEASCMAVRDAMWATTTNVLSTRSDVFTAYILIKMLRPTPGVVQPATGQEFEDLGEVRLVAILDRTNCRIIDTAGPDYGRVDLRVLPRVLGRMLMENP